MSIDSRLFSEPRHARAGSGSNSRCRGACAAAVMSNRARPLPLRGGASCGSAPGSRACWRGTRCTATAGGRMGRGSPRRIRPAMASCGSSRRCGACTVGLLRSILHVVARNHKLLDVDLYEARSSGLLDIFLLLRMISGHELMSGWLLAAAAHPRLAVISGATSPCWSWLDVDQPLGISFRKCLKMLFRETFLNRIE